MNAAGEAVTSTATSAAVEEASASAKTKKLQRQAGARLSGVIGSFNNTAVAGEYARASAPETP